MSQPLTTLTHLHSTTSTVRSLNIKRADPRVTHKLFPWTRTQASLNSVVHLSLSIWRKNQPSFQNTRCSIQKHVTIANKLKKNNSQLFPKATFILQKERRVCPAVLNDVHRMLRSVRYIVPVRRENSSRNPISPARQNRQWFNSIRHSPPDGCKLRNSKNIRSAK